MENNLDNNVREIAPIAKSQSLRLSIEKLDGGYISDITGKRKIYQHADEVVDMLNMNKIIGRLEHAEYKMNIDIVHIDDHQEYLDMEDLRANYKQEAAMSIEEAKECGIIEEAPKFNPMPTEPVLDLHAPIKVTMTNAYTTARLKSIDWKSFDEQLPMTVPEKAKICGMNTTSLYSTWVKVLNGKMEYQRTPTRIAMTILAMYYEKHLGIRTSTKEQCEKMKEDVLKLIRDIELIGDKKSHVKTTDVAKKLVEMRKILM